jgi:hypothetical protein
MLTYALFFVNRNIFLFVRNSPSPCTQERAQTVLLHKNIPLLFRIRKTFYNLAGREAVIFKQASRIFIELQENYSGAAGHQAASCVKLLPIKACLACIKTKTAPVNLPGAVLQILL